MKALKKGQKVIDRWAGTGGNCSRAGGISIGIGVVVEVLKTRSKIKFMDGVVTYDKPHYQFLEEVKKQEGIVADLTDKHCKEKMDIEILIGEDKCKIDKRKKKKFTFNVWENEYSIWVGKKRIEGGQALEELLEVYNDL